MVDLFLKEIFSSQGMKEWSEHDFQTAGRDYSTVFNKDKPKK